MNINSIKILLSLKTEFISVLVWFFNLFLIYILTTITYTSNYNINIFLIYIPTLKVYIYCTL